MSRTGHPIADHQTNMRPACSWLIGPKVIPRARSARSLGWRVVDHSYRSDATAPWSRRHIHRSALAQGEAAPT
jgi:hypothetical protein